LADAAALLSVRQRAATLLGDFNHTQAQSELLRVLPVASEKLAMTIARALANTRTGAAELLTATASGKASARLLQDSAVQIRLNRSGIAHWRERVAELTRDVVPIASAADATLNRHKLHFQKARKDAAVGSQVFDKVCAACHQLANRGSKIGPELDGIGVRGIDRLLEDIIDPNRNVDQSFRSTTLGLADGRVVHGLVLREEGEVIVLADELGKETRIAKKDIEERTLSPISAMPANLMDQMTDAEFYHLLAFLLSQSPDRTLVRPIAQPTTQP
jgi:putative heme-binding domain-containing protein